MNQSISLKKYSSLWGLFFVMVALPLATLKAQHFNSSSGGHHYHGQHHQGQHWGNHWAQYQQPMEGAFGVNGTQTNPDSGMQANPGGSYFEAGACGDQGFDGCCNPCSTGSLYSFRTFGGWNFLDIDRDFNRGWALGGSIGRYVRPQTRLELEFTYRHNAGDQSAMVLGNMNSYSVLTNLVYELSNLQILGISPYIGGGIGITLINGSFTDNMLPYSVDDPVFAYQGFAGLQRKIGRNASVFGEYRYFGTANVDFSNTFSVQRNRYNAENVFIGVQFNY